jgi:DNA-binding NarL/FixJ family response regulator
MKPTPTILLADDHPFVCDGLRTILEPYYAVVGAVHDGSDVLGLVDRLRPDLVLLDLSMPGRSGLWLTRELKKRRPAPRVLVVTMHSDRVYIDEAFRSGADGYLLKTARAGELRKAVSEALAGRTFTSPELLNGRRGEGTEVTPVSDGPWAGELAQITRLTGRQRQVLLLVGKGCTNQEIAERLEVSVKAIEYHRSGIRQSLAISTHAGLYRFATLYASAVEGEGAGDNVGDRIEP